MRSSAFDLCSNKFNVFFGSICRIFEKSEKLREKLLRSHRIWRITQNSKVTKLREKFAAPEKKLFQFSEFLKKTSYQFCGKKCRSSKELILFPFENSIIRFNSFCIKQRISSSHPLQRFENLFHVFSTTHLSTNPEMNRSIGSRTTAKFSQESSVETFDNLNFDPISANEKASFENPQKLKKGACVCREKKSEINSYRFSNFSVLMLRRCWRNLVEFLKKQTIAVKTVDRFFSMAHVLSRCATETRKRRSNGISGGTILHSVWMFAWLKHDVIKSVGGEARFVERKIWRRKTLKIV